MTTERQEPSETKDAPANGRGGTTRVGAPVDSLDRSTRRLSGGEPRRQRPARAGRVSPPYEQIIALIEALGDTAHPLHVTAVEELVAIGAPAVPALSAALGPSKPWLTAYRAAEAVGRIGDGRATGPLIQALSHPNSNVRWSAVRALTQVGDMRALLELRRVAQGDQGRTSWGEPVAGAAQSALDEISRRSVWSQSLELIKTAVVSVLMILSLILAFSVVSTLRAELGRFGQYIPGQTEIPQFTLPTPTAGPELTPAAAAPPPAATTVARPTAAPLLAPTTGVVASGTLTGTVRQDSNVRPFPGINNQPIGRVTRNDEVVFVARDPRGQWYLIRLGPQRGAASFLESPDGTGWINAALVTPPQGELRVQEPAATEEPSLTPTAGP